jgi:hypothetical protein
MMARVAEDRTEVQDVKSAGLSESEMRERLLELVFGGDRRVMGDFVRTVAAGIPDDTAVVVRGSAITGLRSGNWAPVRRRRTRDQRHRPHARRQRHPEALRP